MMEKIENEAALVGSRVRERRMMAGIKQADLAKWAGVSASYLNLIEHNRRRIGGKLLNALAEGLGVDPQSLSQGAEAGLIATLHGASQSKSAQDILGDEANRSQEFAERFPGWAGLIATQSARISQLEAIIDGLNDRLTHDPILSETMHDVLSTASAIRSTASILVATPDIDAEWRARFHTNIDTESRRLAETSAAMAQHFEHLTRSSATYVTPLEASQALFDANGHHFAPIEAAGAEGIEEVLPTSPALTGESLRFARAALHSYAHRAEVFPANQLFEALAEHGFSQLGALAASKGVTLDILLMRLAELPHSPEFPEMGCVQSDGAGGLITRNQLASFSIPRFGSACNLWPVFAAISSPNVPIRQTVQSHEGVAFTTYSVATLVQTPSFDALPLYKSTMLIVADSPDDPALNIGPACRVCPRADCVARREPSILESFTAN